VCINSKNKSGGTFATHEEAQVRRDQLRSEQLGATKAKKDAAGAQNCATPDDAERQAMQQRTDAGLKAIHDAIEQVEQAHAQKVEAAQRAVLEEQASPNRKWKRVPLEAFEPVKDDTRPKLTDMQVVMLSCCFMEASSAGKIRFSKRNGRGKSWSPHRTFGTVLNGYMVVKICGIQFMVHHLCCWTFHGAPPEKGATADHIEHCTRDNRESQLKWATRSQQVTNRRPHRTHLDTWPVEAKVAEDSAWAWYPSTNACAEATGVRPGSISAVLHGVAQNSVGGLFAVRRGAPFEAQTDLLPEQVEFQGQTCYLKAEEWHAVPRAPDWRVSTRGRAQKRHKGHWGPRFTPRAAMTDGRACLRVNGKHERVYNVIWRTFRKKLARGHTVDHIDQDCDNNYLYNLRDATKSQQINNRSTTPSSNVKVIACANPDQFLADKAAFDAASAAGTAAAASRRSNSTCTVFTKEQTMAVVVAAAKRVLAKETDDEGKPARMPRTSETGGLLWMHMKERFSRCKEFAEAIGNWSEKAARDFIVAHTPVKKPSDTAAAVRSRAHRAGAKKRKRASLEAE